MNFAVIEEGIITNIICADSKQIAQTVTGKTCVQYADDEIVYVGGSYDGVNFIPPKPFPSFTYNTVTKLWDAPTPYPTDGKNYKWSEETLSWEVFITPQPFPSWTLNQTTSLWEAPVEKPDASFNWEWNEESQLWTESL
jgi:hypothetical protein